MLLVFTVYALFASIFVVAKDALTIASPLFLIGTRMSIAGLGMLLFSYCTKPFSLRLNKRVTLHILLLGISNIYLTNILELWGLTYLSSSKTCFLYSLSPFLSAIFSWAIFNESFNKTKGIGLIVGFCGFLPVLLSKGADEHISGLFFGFSIAEISVLSAVVCSVIGWLFLHQAVNHYQVPLGVANGYSMLFGGFLALIHSFSTESWTPLPVTNYTLFVTYTLFLTLVSNCIAYNLYGFLLKRFSPTFMSLAGLSTPIFTAILGNIFYNEPISWWTCSSLIIVALGLYIFHTQEPLEKSSQHTSKTLVSESL